MCLAVLCDMKTLSEFTESSLRQVAALRTFGPNYADLIQIYNGQNILWMQSIAESRSVAADPDFRNAELERSNKISSELKSNAGYQNILLFLTNQLCTCTCLISRLISGCACAARTEYFTSALQIEICCCV